LPKWHLVLVTEGTYQFIRRLSFFGFFVLFTRASTSVYCIDDQKNFHYFTNSIETSHQTTSWRCPNNPGQVVKQFSNKSRLEEMSGSCDPLLIVPFIALSGSCDPKIYLIVSNLCLAILQIHVYCGLNSIYSSQISSGPEMRVHRFPMDLRDGLENNIFILQHIV
jgi:hypothetical protein